MPTQTWRLAADTAAITSALLGELRSVSKSATAERKRFCQRGGSPAAAELMRAVCSAVSTSGSPITLPGPARPGRASPGLASRIALFWPRGKVVATRDATGGHLSWAHMGGRWGRNERRGARGGAAGLAT